jgi:hypothetical protein
MTSLACQAKSLNISLELFQATAQTVRLDGLARLKQGAGDRKRVGRLGLRASEGRLVDRRVDRFRTEFEDIAKGLRPYCERGGAWLKESGWYERN